MAQEKKTIYLFFGGDSFSSNQKVNQWRQEFEKKYGDINIEILQGHTLCANDLEIAIGTTPFLGEKRLVIVYDFLAKGNTDEQKKAADILEKNPDTCICVFIENGQPDQRTTLFKRINKLGSIKEFGHLAEQEITAWIAKKALEKNIKISTKSSAHLSSLTGPNLWTLENELEKLSMYCKGREIMEADIDELVKPTFTSTIFKLTDYLSAKNRKKSLETLNILRDSGEELLMILFMIARHFRILILMCDLVKKGLSKNEIINQTKEHPYVVQIAMNQCRNFDIETLKKIYRNLHELDIAVKTGKIGSSGDSKRELSLAVEKFIVELCG